MYTHIYIFVHMHIHIYICIYVLYIRVYIYAYMYICLLYISIYFRIFGGIASKMRHKLCIFAYIMHICPSDIQVTPNMSI